MAEGDPVHVQVMRRIEAAAAGCNSRRSKKYEEHLAFLARCKDEDGIASSLPENPDQEAE